MGELYQVYLIDTNKINELHNAAFKKSSKSAVELIRFNNSIDSDQLLDDDIPERVNMTKETNHVVALEKTMCCFFSLAQSAFATGWHVQDHKTVSSDFCLW